jgi:aldehyde:ferredoxin oxidoreductase
MATAAATTARDNRTQTILWVDLSSGSIRLETLSEAWTAKYLGCRGVNARLLFDSVPAGTDPLGPDNVLFFGTGPLDGLPVGMGRTSIACKSPRGTVAEGSCGGFFGPEMRRAGVDYIAIRGQADRPVYLHIEDGASGVVAELRDARHLWGLKTDETDMALRQELSDPNTQFRYIGPAAENLVHASPIFGNLNNSGGRAGCGQVMGSKGLKAIAVRGRQGIRVADYDAFLDAYKILRQRLDLATSRDMWTPVWSTYGAPVLARLFPDLGNLMTRNAQQMDWDNDKAMRISSEPYLDEYVTKAKACFCCPWPACQKLHKIDSGKHQGFKGGNYWAAQPVALGSLIDNDDLELLLVLSGLCNQYGLDVFHVGYTLAWAMECFENGLLTTSDTDGLELRFGCNDKDGLVELMRKIALREGFGDLLARGCTEAAKIVGQNSEQFCLAVKGQELEGIPQRNLYMVALGVAVSEVGPDHTRWYPPYPCNPSLISPEKLAELGIDLDLRLAFQGRNPVQKGKLLRWFTISRAIVESMPSCVFLVRDTLGLDMRPWWNLFNAATGADLDYAEFVMAGERLMNLDRAFNVREGYRRADDHPPIRMATEDVPGFGYPKLAPEVFEPMLDEYYEANGWSVTTSIPTRSKLVELGLDDVAAEFDALGIEVEP